MKPALDQLDLRLEVVCDGLQFPEGPVAMADGSVLLVEMQRQTITRVRPDGGKTVVARCPGGPNGLAVGPDGALYLANNGGVFSFTRSEGLLIPGMEPRDYRGGSLQRVDLATGVVDTLYTHCGGDPLRAPNDLVFDKSGNIWFTDFGAPTRNGRRFGGLYYASPGGSSIAAVRDGMLSLNGVGLSPDEGTVYASDSFLGRLWAFDLSGPGRLSEPPANQPGRVVCNLQDVRWPDGLAVEANGLVCVATAFANGINVFDDAGPVAFLAVSDAFTTNLCFGGPDMRDVWITGGSTGRLYKCRWPRRGLDLNFNA